MAIADNTAALRAILNTVNGLPSASSGPVYGKAVFFGDSLCEGAGNDGRGYADILADAGIFESVKKYAKSGGTIGPYMGNTSDNQYCLTNVLARSDAQNDVKDADIIFIQYQNNDASAVMAGRVSMGSTSDGDSDTTVCGYAVQAIKRIYELNPTLRIIWLASARNDFALLYKSFYGEPDKVDAYILFDAVVLQMVRLRGCAIIDISESYNYSGMLGSDGAHPDENGYRCIAENILHNMFRTTHYITPIRPLSITANNYGLEPSPDGNFASILKLLKAGVSVPISVYMGDTGAVMNCVISYFNAAEIVFNYISITGEDLATAIYKWNETEMTCRFYM